MVANITVLSTGGTIASTDGEGGATPSKNGDELLAAVPTIDEYATLSIEQVTQRPSFDMDPAAIADVGRFARGAAERGADGVVVTHGTDTMEESAYYLDLALDLDVPVVFTGAQRRPDEISSDGPSNLLTAVRAASHDRVNDGVYIAFDEELHAARDATKTHTRKLGTFGSPGKGPVAAVAREGVRFHREPGSCSADVPVLDAERDVALVKSGAGVDGAAIERAVDAGVDGLVVEGTGLGNATAAIGDAIEATIDAGVPVVVTSRCHAGAVAPVYGTGGGGRTLRAHGALFGGDLPAHKARIKLMLALSADDIAVEQVFDTP
ncbi:asparaginase [Natrinema versiforme]|uniref:L-asparaginase n=1 Tax=Natrinema versiforme JCM 10478 TaxID=1227496 RepID=L9XVM2_9EURY|nr:asparaginase [Natrinema versiforme]ELY65527.1 asparaginase [Natrinema versiforme JCM 10478]